MNLTLVLRTPESVSHAHRMLDSLPKITPHEITIKPYKSSRSLAQNNLLHKWMAVVSQQYAEATGKFYTTKHWKIYFKQMFLGERSFEVNGRIVTVIISTKDLKVDEFTALLEKIDLYCGSELQIILPHPEDLYREAMERPAPRRNRTIEEAEVLS